MDRPIDAAARSLTASAAPTSAVLAGLAVTSPRTSAPRALPVHATNE